MKVPPKKAFFRFFPVHAMLSSLERVFKAPMTLLKTLEKAEAQGVIGAESRVMLEGVLRMSTMTTGQVMVPAPKMDMIDIQSSFESILHLVIETAHSRFPVFDGDRENIIGMLMAKDLLKRQRSPDLNLRALLRPAVFVPESKGLNDLLREFRGSRYHLAIVVDEFGQVAGLITIEDVLEQIVGEIEDEFDQVEDDGGDIFGLADRTYRVSGDTPLDRVAFALGFDLSVEESGGNLETIGGWIAHALGHVPQRGEHFDWHGQRFQVLHSQGGVVRWFKVYPIP